MTRAMKSLTALTIIGMVSMLASRAYAQDLSTTSIDDQTRQIRLKKLVNEWQGSILTLHARDGEEISGRLIEVSAGNYHLEVGTRLLKVPLEDVIQVSYEPGPPEILLSIASSIMGGAFLSGALLILQEDASDANISSAALLGMMAGGFWGYSIFYESEIIYSE